VNWLYCRACDSRIGSVPKVIGGVEVTVVWRGAVKDFPEEPDGLIYCQCRRCRRFQKYEIQAPSTKEIAA
jgi:hypothetical protein